MGLSVDLQVSELRARTQTASCASPPLLIQRFNVQEYKDGKLVQQYPLAAADIAGIAAALGSSGSSAAGASSSRQQQPQQQQVTPLGEVVFKEHSVYDLMVQLQLGIR